MPPAAVPICRPSGCRSLESRMSCSALGSGKTHALAAGDLAARPAAPSDLRLRVHSERLDRRVVTMQSSTRRDVPPSLLSFATLQTRVHHFVERLRAKLRRRMLENLTEPALVSS